MGRRAGRRQRSSRRGVGERRRPAHRQRRLRLAAVDRRRRHQDEHAALRATRCAENKRASEAARLADDAAGGWRLEPERSSSGVPGGDCSTARAADQRVWDADARASRRERRRARDLEASE